MRISETLVVQHVDGDPPQVVFVDDTSGAEVALNPVDLIRAEGAVEYFRLVGAFPTRAQTCQLADHPPVRVDDLESGQTICACGAVLRPKGLAR